jgi:hypothetical protein
VEVEIENIDPGRTVISGLVELSRKNWLYSTRESAALLVIDPYNDFISEAAGFCKSSNCRCRPSLMCPAIVGR